MGLIVLTMSLGIRQGIPNGRMDANRDSPLTTRQFRDSLSSSGCTDMELGFSCPNIPTESFVVSTRCRLSCLAYQGMGLL